MKKFFAVLKQPIEVDAALFLMRLVCGYAFMTHGTFKIQNPFHWMGPDAGTPAIFQALAALSEFGGGLALIIGLLTRLASFGIACTMVVAMYTHAVLKGDPFVSSSGGHSYELAAVFFTMAVLFLAGGPGRISLDRKIFGLR